MPHNYSYDWNGTSVQDILNENPWIDPDACNHAQLLIVTIVYGVVLYQSSNLIANGSEFLLLVPSMAGVVGSIVLPILGAVPDGMMTLCSGLGPDAQDSVSAGVGVLAGSTVMLLTFPWFIAVTFGRVPIEGGKANFSKSGQKSGLFDSGITYDKDIKQNAGIMLGTTLLYLIIQVPAWFLDKPNPTRDQTLAQGSAESKWAAVGGIAALVAFMGYLYICFLASKEDKVLECVIDGIKNKKISLGGALEFLVSSKDDKKKELLDDKNLKTIMRPFFAKYDADSTGSIEKSEFMVMVRDLDDQMAKNEIDDLWKSFNPSGGAEIKFQEFCTGFRKYLDKPDTPGKLKNRQKTITTIPNYDEAAAEEDGEEEIPEDLADLPYADQQRAIKLRAAWMMALGTFVVVVVSDPFVDVLTNWGDRLGIPAFYISFVVAPFASNASELLSAYTYAKKKTKGAITTSISTLVGAACMNNTFCLGIFYGLIYFQNLAWQFTAETTAIILIQWIIGLLAMARDTQTWFVGFVILLMYPFCLFVVYYLEQVVGWD